MKKLLLPSLVLSFLMVSSCKQEPKLPEAPVARKEAKNMEIHGDTRTDDYFWMRLSDEQKTAETPDAQTQEVLDYLEAENDYLAEVMAPTKALQDTIYEEIVARYAQDDQSVPYTVNGYSYYVRYEEGGQYPLYCRKSLEEGAEEEILLNGPAMAEGKAYFAIGDWSVSEDNRLLAYTVDTVSRRQYTAYVKNLETGELLPDRIDNIGGVTWANDNETFFYAKKDPQTLRTFQIYKHELGESATSDDLIFQEDDNTYSIYAFKSSSRDYLFIASYHAQQTEFRYLSADTPDGDWQIFQPRVKDHFYSVDHIGDQFMIRTNHEAENYKLVSCSEGATTMENWEEVIPYNPEVFFEQMVHFKDYSVLEERIEGLSQFHVLDRSGDSEYYIEFDDPTYRIGFSANPESDTDTFRFSYSSFTTPGRIYDYNLSTKERTLMKEDPVMDPSFDPENYVSERMMATAEDGTEVPISLVYRKGLELGASTPLLLYAYGSYGSTMDASFSNSRLSLLDRGFVYALAHVRGGQEMGRQWYEQGRLLNKKNTFTDFIDCAKHLVAEGYTSPDHLYAMGGSAGGLLMGAIINMEPELWNGVIAAVPWVDVVTTMLDESIPLTTFEFDEWGNPKNKEYYDYMLSYSPYDNVEAKEYPNMLVTTGFWDSQVQYWEPAKWVAKLRDRKTDDNLLLLETNMDTGHGGASGRFERFRRVALMYAFLLKLEEGS
ncbi:oligopeptidase B [Robiginitalea myxolifaciens]|uniref:Proline-specific endopeptidase n=1 Tax=Robiginitalea myxolifaciens TaxID=400055 RepID=A0A1I6FY59_9FLAO|nr:S9 family peptidase [Robiginitalea myxolifaciens]SFR34873.1 oligopeptidase B [Robiginitalea myxolifaciens]